GRVGRQSVLRGSGTARKWEECEDHRHANDTTQPAGPEGSGNIHWLVSFITTSSRPLPAAASYEETLNAPCQQAEFAFTERPSQRACFKAAGSRLHGLS